MSRHIRVVALECVYSRSPDGGRRLHLLGDPVEASNAPWTHAIG